MNTSVTVDSLPVSARAHRLDSVDGLRGLAALLIVVYHLFSNAGHPELRLFGLNLLRPLHDGWCGVNLFLVLSGFCLYWPLAKHPHRRLSVVQFMQKRSWRLLPAYYASLLLIPGAFALLNLVGVRRDIANPLELPQSWQDMLVHATLLHSLWPSTIWSWNGVTWSLGLEWTWYLLFPAAVWIFRRVGAFRALLVMLAIMLSYRLGLYVLLGPAGAFPAEKLNVSFTLRSFVLARFFEFGLGMYVASIAEEIRTRGRGMIWPLPVSLFSLGLAHAATPVDVFLPIRDSLYGIAFAALLIGVIQPGKAVVSRILHSPVLVKTGEWSYSLYLLHMPLVIAGLALLRWMGLNGLGLFLASLTFIPAMVLVAYVSFMCFEQPFLRKKTASASTEDASHLILAT